MKLTTRVLALALAAAVPLPALAHKLWLLPSYTILSPNEWVTVDAAVSNELFLFNHNPARLDSLRIISPSGRTASPKNSITAKYRSSFDVELDETGTWRIALVMHGLTASWEESGEPRRWRGTVENFASEVPADADRLEVHEMVNRVETFVTAGAPTTGLFKPSGKGLELVPVTHPNDLFVGEAAQFKLLLDGKPAANLKVLLVPGGIRYRDAQNEIEAQTDAEGAFGVEWPTAGMYWLNASIEDRQASKPASGRRASYSATLEVLPQ